MKISGIPFFCTSACRCPQKVLESASENCMSKSRNSMLKIFTLSPPSKNFPSMNSSTPRGSTPTPMSLTLFSLKIGCKADISFAPNRQKGHPKRRKKTITHLCVLHKSPYLTAFFKELSSLISNAPLNDLVVIVICDDLPAHSGLS